MKVILLDRNIVIDIKKYNSGREVEHIHATKADQPSNFVSPLLSIIEGSLKGEQSLTEMYDCLIEETEALQTFFKKAKTDAIFLQRNAFDMVNTFAGQLQDDIYHYTPLVKFLQYRLADPIAKKSATDVRREILEYTVEHFLYPGHPITICGLACLHGNKKAHGVLKPNAFPPNGDKDKHAYNALLDLLKVSQLAYIRSMFRSHKSRDQVDFLTRDFGLIAFLTEFKATVKRSQIDTIKKIETVEYNCNFTGKLFPNLMADKENLALLQDDVRNAALKAALVNTHTPRLRPMLRAFANLN